MTPRAAAPGRVAIVGHGRFGRALGALLAEAGMHVAAWDPAPFPGAAGLVPSLEAAVAGADAVVLAVPVQALRAAASAVRPLLAPGQLVLDVGSVKLAPRQALEEVLGDEVPWALTHPLFGPASLARGERPLSVVVCPDPARAEAVARAEALFVAAGCAILRETADDHDRAMARTHALAFFVAKGLVDLGGEPAPGPLAPPSYLAMARTVETVRADAGHLFWAIEAENPHAAGARQGLLDALSRVHAELAGGARPAEDAAPPLSIPDLGPAAPDLREVRALIDELDDELLGLLARRAALAIRAGRAKRAEGRPIRDPAREDRLLRERAERALVLGLDPGLARDVFDALLPGSRRLQEQDDG